MTISSDLLYVPTETFLEGKDWYYKPNYKPVIEEHVDDITVTNFSLLFKYLCMVSAICHFSIIIGVLGVILNDKKYE